MVPWQDTQFQDTLVQYLDSDMEVKGWRLRGIIFDGSSVMWQQWCSRDQCMMESCIEEWL